MQSVARRVRFSTKSPSSYRPQSRLLAGRTYATLTGSPLQTNRHTGLLLASTAVLSATVGYLLANRTAEKIDSPTIDLGGAQYGTSEDFRKAIKELKATFPEPGAVSDDPVVVAPYGFSQNDYHPGKSSQPP